MTLSVARVVISLILAPCIAVAAVAAPEHLHESDATHPHAAVHRHLQPHSVAGHDDDHAQLAEDDAHVVWLESVFLCEAAYHLAPPAVPSIERFELVPATGECAPRPEYDTAPPHGPPRATLSLRGPPAPLA